MPKIITNHRKIKQESTPTSYIVTIDAYKSWLIIIIPLSILLSFIGMNVVLANARSFNEILPLDFLLILFVITLVFLWFKFGKTKIEFGLEHVLFSKTVFGIGWKKKTTRDKVCNFEFKTLDNENQSSRHSIKAICFNIENKEYFFGIGLNPQVASNIVDELNKRTDKKICKKNKSDKQLQSERIMNRIFGGGSLTEIKKDRSKIIIAKLGQEYMRHETEPSRLGFIKFLNKKTGLGLKHAKIISSFYFDNDLSNYSIDDVNIQKSITLNQKEMSLDELAEEFIKSNNGDKTETLRMIKYIKDNSTLGLKEAKEFVSDYLSNDKKSKDTPGNDNPWIIR